MARNYWVNPPPYLSRGFQALWVVGEQQNLSWVTAVESSNNLTLVQNRGEELGNLAANITTGYDRNSFVWIVQLYGFDLNESNNFYFILALEGSEGNGVYNSSFFNITNQSSPATATPTLGSTATSASVVTLTSSPSSAPLTGLSRETLGIALGIGIPGLIAILVTLFFLLKQKTLPDENPTPTQCTPRRVWPRQQIFEVANDFTYGAELSGDRNSRYFAELPITG